MNIKSTFWKRWGEIITVTIALLIIAGLGYEVASIWRQRADLCRWKYGGEATLHLGTQCLVDGKLLEIPER